MKTIRIEIPDKQYNVYLGQNIFHNISKIFAKEDIKGNLLLVLDHNIKKFHKHLIQNSFNEYPGKVSSITIITTEKNKSLQTYEKIQKHLVKNNFGRDSIIVAVGGGIIGDITGFVAATYMRGIKYIQIPTTLLAAVDSSVGGKTGINFGMTKNIIGSFYQPELVFIDTKFFDTLLEEEILCGAGEIVKYAFLTNVRFYNYIIKNIENILRNDEKVVQKIVGESVKYKGAVVQADEKESGIRKVLNLGHTFAHAYEVEQKHKLKHGQAVIVGITSAIILSHKINLLPNKSYLKFMGFLSRFNKMIRMKKPDTNQIYKIMLRDKKNRSNSIQFVLIKDIGELATDINVERKVVINSINETIKLFS